SFKKFRAANQNICCFCGSSELAQVRSEVEENEQWRAANDHLLSKDEYPFFAVHPENLVPLCETCNSKAKLAKDLLTLKRKDHPDERRRCFFPFTESCHQYVGVVLERGDFGLRARFVQNPNGPEIEEKLDTWNDVYQIQRRIEGKFTDLTVIVDSDFHANDYADFFQRIHDRSVSCEQNVRAEGWEFWKCRLYQWLSNDGEALLEELWSSIEDRRSDPDAAAVYGI
ncbi:MAG: hypothetical protein MI754_00470, partial [Chromatiales bacterium]|nr:hypothetical protein [Chromatiales bacterium]